MKKVVISLSILFLVGFGVQAQKKDCVKVIRRIKSNKARKSGKRMASLDKKDPFYYGASTAQSGREHFAVSKATRRAARDLSIQAKDFIVSNFADISKDSTINDETTEVFIAQEVSAAMSSIEFPYKRFCMYSEKKGDKYFVSVAVRAQKELVEKGILSLIDEDGKMKSASLYFNVKKIQDLFIKQDQEEIE